MVSIPLKYTFKTIKFHNMKIFWRGVWEKKLFKNCLSQITLFCGVSWITKMEEVFLNMNIKDIYWKYCIYIMFAA